jgi:hypothetical protein
MKRSNEPSHREPREIQIHRLRFIREHDGKPERVLKDRLVEFFTQRAKVQRAYLAQVSSGDQPGVALCLTTRHGPDHNLAREVGSIFAALFVRQEHIDILFLVSPRSRRSGVFARRSM